MSFMPDYVAEYQETSTTALSADPEVAVPLLTINGWILVHRKVTGGSVSFNKNWAEYRDGFGSAAGDDNYWLLLLLLLLVLLPQHYYHYYWLGFDKLYRLMQMGSATLRVEVHAS